MGDSHTTQQGAKTPDAVLRPGEFPDVIPIFELDGDVDIPRDEMSTGVARSRPGMRGALSVLVLAVGIVLGIGLAKVHISPVGTSGNANGTGTADTGFQPVSNDIIVDVKGDVRKPGLVKVPATSRMSDVIQAAGGFVHPADSSAMNLAAPVDDGQEVVVPDVTRMQTGGGAGVPEASNPVSSAPQAPASVQGTMQTDMKIDLNTASVETLETIPGIGPAKATAIVAYREGHGGFRSVSQLEDISGIGPVTYARIVPYVVILQSPLQ